MRIIAGILMIIVGLISAPLVPFGETMSGILVLLWFLSLGLTIGDGICAFKKKAYWWAMTGAICSVLVAFTHTITFAITSLLRFPLNYVQPGTVFTLMGIMTVIILRMRRGEFQS